MKKLLAVLAVLFVMGTTSVFALGIGAQGGWNPVGGGSDGALTFKLDDKPWVFAVNGSAWNGYISVGVTADMWLANPKISGGFGYYYGWGLAGGVNIYGGQYGYISGIVGARVLAGLNFKMLDNFFELYLQAAWQPGVSISTANGIHPIFNAVPVNLGFRFWI